MVDLAGLGSRIEWTDSQSAAEARVLVSLDAGLGGLDGLREWLAATSFRFPPHAPRHPVCVVVGHASARAQAVTEQVNATLEALDVPESDSVTDALDRGVALADAGVDAGCDLLIVADPDPSPAAALLVSVLADLEPVALLARGAGAVDTDRWIARAEALRDLRRDVIALRGRPGELLDAVDQPSLAATTGLILRAAARRTPIVLDGSGAAAAALLCHTVQARTGRWWRFADRSPDPVHTKVMAELSAHPILNLGTSAGDGVAGMLTLPLLRAAAVGDAL